MKLNYGVLQIGDIISVFNKSETGLWRGSLNGQLGMFKFAHVQPLTLKYHRTPSDIPSINE